MGILAKFFGLSLENPASPLLPYSYLSESLGMGRSDAGVQVNSKTAMRYSTVFSCVRVISEDLSRISLDIFQAMPDGSMRLATDHKNYYLLHDRPNPGMSSMTWRMAMLSSVCLHGNAYSWIKRDNAARVVALVPLDATKTSPVQRDGVMMYATTQTDSGQTTFIDSEDILHFMGPTENGIVGASPIQLCKNMVGLGIAAESFGAKLFGNGSKSSGVFTHPQRLDPESYANLKKSLYEVATGDNALRPLILEEGMAYSQLTINPNDAQFMELRRWQKEDVAQCFRIPLNLLQDLQRATNANLEFQGSAYVRHTLMPYAVQMESEIKYKIIGKGPYSVEHNFADLTRGDLATQTAAFISLRNAGIFSANDVLRGLRQNPIPEEEGGNIRVLNGAFIPLDSLLDYEPPRQPTSEQQNPDPSEGAAVGYRRSQFESSYRPLFRDAVGRSVHRSNDREFVKKAFFPAVMSMAEGLIASRFGQTVTDDDRNLVVAVVNQIAASSSGWKKDNASATATELTSTVFAALSEGLYEKQISQ